MVAGAKQMMISGVGEKDGSILAVSGPKFMNFWDDVVSNAVSQLSISGSSPETMTFKVPIELRSLLK